MKPFENEKKILPAFPRTAHLPYQANTAPDDCIASAEEAAAIFRDPCNIEEKIDGASVGMALHQGEPLIRNRDHILRKGYLKDTPAKLQFRPIWGWFYEHRASFEHLARTGDLSVYGDWCLAQHGLAYDQLPDWFIAYDLYDQETGQFLSPVLARRLLEEAGFVVPRLFHQGVLQGQGYEDLERWARSPGDWTRDSGPIEGVYCKTYDEHFVTGRFKLVRPGFVQGVLWSQERIIRNSLRVKG